MKEYRVGRRDLCKVRNFFALIFEEVVLRLINIICLWMVGDMNVLLNILIIILFLNGFVMKGVLLLN